LITQHNVISREQALSCGMTRVALGRRIRPGGPWQRLLAGVYLAQTGGPALPHKEMAALPHPKGVFSRCRCLRVIRLRQGAAAKANGNGSAGPA
jgi:hypothetical protein